MKPPSTVEARVAEELRNWLSSELEQLDASNTNQFAHHVVTILLHEDLDIEDEPLTAGDDFLHDICNIRRGKTRDKQKKAAVQFLRSAVCCNDPGEAEIQGVVDELMVKIEETKIKMNSKSSPKRISVNVQNSFNQSGVKSDLNDRERLYNEAFPSLHSNNNSNSSLVWHRLGMTGTENSRDIARSRQQVESAHRPHIFNSQEEAHACNTARRVVASALPESVLPSFETTEILSSDEQMSSSALDSFSDTYSCWSIQSAFQACTLLKKFVPTTSPLKPVCRSDTRIRSLKEFSPTVIPIINQSDLQSIHLDPRYEKTLTDHPQLFRPIKESIDSHNTPQSVTDIEVDRIFNASHYREQEMNRTDDKYEHSVLVTTYDGGGANTELARVSIGNPCSREDTLEDDDDDDDDGALSDSILDMFKGIDENTDEKLDNLRDESNCLGLTLATQNSSLKVCSPEKNRDRKFFPRHIWEISNSSETWTSEIDEVCSFPQHHGGFWKLLADTGSMTLYPVLNNQMIFELEDRIETCHQKLIMSPCTLFEPVPAKNTGQVTACDKSTDDSSACRSRETSMDYYFREALPDACEQWVLESSCIQVQYFYAGRQIAHVQQEHYSRLQQATLQNPFLPSLLSSCLSHEGSQFLQRAFVNSYFSDLLKEPVYTTQDKLSGFRCSDLEHCWLSPEMLEFGGFGQAQVEVVPGCTCSSWLENNCHLGDSCPFSHPSV